MDASAKQVFLVAYDYGSGGLWGAVLARSEADIRRLYPELTIVHERPRWMSDEDHARICRDELHDIDGPAWGILDVVLADRSRG